jgi:hypothetical protein
VNPPGGWRGFFGSLLVFGNGNRTRLGKSWWATADETVLVDFAVAVFERVALSDLGGDA